MSLIPIDTRPSGHDAEYPFANDAVTASPYASGWFAHRDDVDAAGPAADAYTGFAVHEYECVSNNDNSADMIRFPVNVLNGKFRYDRAVIGPPPSLVPTRNWVSADESYVFPRCTYVSNDGATFPPVAYVPVCQPLVRHLE